MPSHHTNKPAQDTSVLSAGKLLQTRLFQPDISNNQQAPQLQEKPEALTGGFDLTQKLLVSDPPPISPLGQPLQAKLTIGEPNDKYEQEADRVAHDVVQRIHASGGTNDGHHPSDQPQTKSLIANPIHPLQRAATREDEERLQKKPLGNMQRFAAGAGTASAEVEQGINNARGGGQSLTPKLQAQMGQAIGADFSGVRVHTDARADQLNRSVGARAFTTGQDLFFKRGEYQPGSRGGQELIAHELTHVVQQDNSRAIRRKFTASGWGEDFSSVIRSDTEEAKTVIQAIVNDPKSSTALEEIKDTYTDKKTIKAKFVKDKAADLHQKPTERKKLLEKYANDSKHDTGLVYKDSYQHLYYLWVNCIASSVHLGGKASEEAELPENHFKTVILGVGSAAGYYIMGQLANLNSSNTAIIGYEQPWDLESPLARAIAINHENQAWTLDPIASGVEDSDDNRSKQLTQQIQQVRKAVTWKNAEIISTEPDQDTGKHKVTYRVKGEGSPANAENDLVGEERVLYADLVISALGGGKEAILKDQVAVATHNENDPEKMQEGIPPVFTLNEYQRWLAKAENKELIAGKLVIISGANAGVDAVYTSTQAGANVSWVVAGGMAYAPAMKNTDIQWDNVSTISYGYATLKSYQADAGDDKRVTVQNAVPGQHAGARKQLTGDPKEQGTVDALNLASGGKANQIIAKIRTSNDDLQGHTYVIAVGQDDTDIAKVAGIPTSGGDLARMRVVYSDGRISSKPIPSEKGVIDETGYTELEKKHAVQKRGGETSYDTISPTTKWSELAPRLNSIARQVLARPDKVDFTKMAPENLVAEKKLTENDLGIQAPTVKIQPVAIYKQYDENDNPRSVQNAKKGTLIIGAQARPYIGKAGYSTSAVDQVGQVVDIGQITPARQAIQQVTNIAARGAIGKADYTYGTRDEIAATVAVKGLTGITADLITEAIIWSRSLPGLGLIHVDPENAEADERLDPAPRTKRMKGFWDAVLTDLGG